MTDDLVTFLRARLDEDHALAIAARDAHVGVYEAEGDAEWYANDEQSVYTSPHGIQVTPGEWVSAATAAHIARHDPARVLADITAKRALLARYEELRANAKARGLVIGEAEEYQDVVLPLLTLPYATHPDYRPEWNPDA